MTTLHRDSWIPGIGFVYGPMRVHWLAAKMAEPTVLVEWPCCGEIEVVRPGAGTYCPNCGNDSLHLPTDFWRKAFPTQDGGTMPNPYGSIDPNPPRQWTDSEKRAGAAIARAVRC